MLRTVFRSAWNRFRDDETGAVCVAGCLEVDAGLLKVQIDPAGALACGGAGLKAVRSPDPCNGLQVRANGLFTECVNNIVNFADQFSPQAALLPIPVSNPSDNPATPTTFGFLNDNSPTSIHVCNTTCCAVEGFFELTVGGLELDANVGFFGNMHLDINVNSGGFVDVNPPTEQVADNVGNGLQRISFNGMHAEFTPTIAPGACIDIQWAQILVCNAGTGTLFNIGSGPRFVTRWMFVQNGCIC